MRFINSLVYKIQRSYQKFHNKRAIEKRELFISLLDERQKNAFNIVSDVLNGYQSCICYKYSSTFVIEKEVWTGVYFGIKMDDKPTPLISSTLINIDLYASQCMVSITIKDAHTIKDFEARYFDENASYIFEQMVNDCLKRKHRDFIEKRNKLII